MPPSVVNTPAPVRTPGPMNTPGPNIPSVRSGSLPQLVTNRRLQRDAAARRPAAARLESSWTHPNRTIAATPSRSRKSVRSCRSAVCMARVGTKIATRVNTSALLAHASAGAYIPQLPGDIGRPADGSWVCRFPSTVSQQVVPLKLTVLHESWGVSIDLPEPTRIVLRKTQATGFWSSKKGGLEVVVTLPDTIGVGEVTVNGTLFGSPPPDLARQPPDLIPRMIGEIRTQLGECRGSPQAPARGGELPDDALPDPLGRRH